MTERERTVVYLAMTVAAMSVSVLLYENFWLSLPARVHAYEFTFEHWDGDIMCNETDGLTGHAVRYWKPSANGQCR